MIRKFGLFAVWVVATLATFASLYLKEGRGLDPCYLCWIQRICLFPLVITAGQAAWHNFYGIVSYLLPQTIIGLLISIYQFYITTFSHAHFLVIKDGCAPHFHITFVAFVLINALLIILLRVSKKGAHESK